MTGPRAGLRCLPRDAARLVMPCVCPLQVPLRMMESVECRDMFQLHIVCKDSKVIRYLFNCYIVDAAAGRSPRSAPASPFVLPLELSCSWPGLLRQSSLSMCLGWMNLPTEDDLLLALQVSFFHL